jgi:tetratricopeptide (TPR) repeat protein
MAGKPISIKALRGAHEVAQVPPRLGVRIVIVAVALQLLLLAALLMLFPSRAGAASVKGELSVATAGGYARLVFTLADEVEADVHLTNGIAIIAFKRAIDVPVDRIVMQAGNYVNAARIDPDGTAVRLALNRKVTVNTMAAGEKLFVDLLPEGWVGLAPGLPPEVVEDLARRARNAEKKERQQEQLTRQRTLPPVRVRVGLQPTFTRYTFGLPALIAVSTERGDDKMTMTFEAPLRFDLGDVLAALPPTVSNVEAQARADSALVQFDFVGKVDVRTFREDNNYIVDIQTSRPRPEAEAYPDLAKIAAGIAAQSAPAPAPKKETQPSQPAKTEQPAKPAAQAKAAPQVKPAESATPAQPAKPAEQAAPAQPAKLPEPAQPAQTPKPAQPIKPGEHAVAQPAKPAETVLPAQPVKPAEIAAPAETAKPQAAPPALVIPDAPKIADAPKTIPAHVEEDVKSPPTPNSGRVTAEARRQGDALRITFPFAQPTSAAMFRRADTIWLVFDSQAPIDIAQIAAQSGLGVRNAVVTNSSDGQVVQLKLDRPKLTSTAADGNSWTVIVGDTMLDPTQPLSAVRTQQAARASVMIPFQQPRTLHRLTDGEIGDTLLVVTASGPARGFLKPQEFVEFNVLASTQGVVIQPLADDVAAELGADKIMVTRPFGLTLSSANARPFSPPANDGARRSGGAGALDPQVWGADREGDYRDRQASLVTAAAGAEEGRRMGTQLDLARFYLARDMVPEAKGVLDVAASDERAAKDGTAFMMRAIANVLLGRGADALKDLSNAAAASRNDAMLWRALAQAKEGKWVEAREGFRALDTETASLPLELQRFAFQEAVRAAVEVNDFGGAATLLGAFDTLGPAQTRDTELVVLKGRVMEGLGRLSEALALYKSAAESSDRPAAVRGQLREIALRQSIGEMKRDDATNALESLAMSWRGDETEADAMQLLSRLYVEDGRYRDAFRLMRTALTHFPQSEASRRIHDESAVAFEGLFLGGKGDSMDPIGALSLFYDFRDLTPVGRRGDEMIRKFADRLVSVDLLDQAAEVLQHQVDQRLQGAARAQVAVKLAVIYLMSHKPDRAISVLRATRSADLPNELRNQRLLLEARAQSDVGRTELAVEVIESMQGREVDRLRADILWRARRWRQAGEQIEKNYGERWRDFAPLTAPERADVMRAAIGYALAEDAIGLDRFRTKYAPKMAEGPDRHAFEVVTAPFNTSAPEFADIARMVSATDTLDAFLRDIRAKYPETSAPAPAVAPRPAAPAQPAVPSRGASAATNRAG